MYAGHLDFSVPLVTSVPSFATAAECAAIVARYREGPWLAATVNSAAGRVVSTAIRDNTLALVADGELARDLTERVRAHVAPRMTVEHPKRGRVAWHYEGLYSPLRIYRYEPGQHFGLHHDQSYVRDEGCRSLVTFMLYLNEDFEGGTTTFPDQSKVVVPKTGSALFFQHAVLHSGDRVSRGTKLALRTDVLYRVAE